MAKIFLITLDPATSTSPGPFNIYYNTTSSDSLIAASPSSANKSSLLSGVYVTVSDDVKSIFLENIATGCGNIKEINVQPPTPTPTPTPTSTPTATPTSTPTATPTPTPSSSPTPTPTVTLVPPTATPVPPTATPVPPTATPTPTPTLTPTPTTTASPCYCFNVRNTSGSSRFITYTDCAGILIPSLELIDNEFLQLCYNTSYGSPSAVGPSGGLTIDTSCGIPCTVNANCISCGTP